jgi:hypothetical protein
MKFKFSDTANSLVVWMARVDIPAVELFDRLTALLPEDVRRSEKFRYQQFRKRPRQEEWDWTNLIPLTGVRSLLAENQRNEFWFEDRTKFRFSLKYWPVLPASTPSLPPRRSLAIIALLNDVPLNLGQVQDFIAALSSKGVLSSANLVHQNYSGWQRTDSIEYYAKLYGSIEGFRLTKPPGSDFERLDISLNPGSGRGSDHQPKRVSADMWLGPHFWSYASCTKEEVLAADFFIEKRDTPHYLYLKSWPHPFTRPDGEQGRVQQKLWRLLYHQDCEWPPGSGGISDVPVGGPPELMP